MDFEILENWSPERDNNRRNFAEKFLTENNIKYSIPSLGCFKIESNTKLTIMFYPKSAKIIWKEHKADRQRHFVNTNPEKILNHLKKII